ncbi:MAG: hypothetical protein HY898_07740 [Deltaproteobacteria bacterium]|nr:hypothetical protein [Deltaproteobacteria bacterium]
MFDRTQLQPIVADASTTPSTALDSGLNLLSTAPPVTHPMALWKDPALYLVGLAALFVCLPFASYVHWLGDEGAWLHGAERLLRGQPVHTGFFALTPGVYVVTAGWMTLFGPGIAAMRTLALCTILGIALLAYSACRSVSGSRPLAACCAIAWVLTTQGTWTTISHHWMSALACMATLVVALYAVENPSRAVPALVAAGLFAGTAASVTGTRGLAALVIAVAASVRTPKPLRATLALTAAVAVTPCLAVLTMLAAGAIHWTDLQASFSLVERFASTQGLPFGAGADPQSRPIIVLFPLAAVLLAGVVARGGWRLLLAPRTGVILAAAVSAFICCFPRADAAHIAFNAPLALPLFTWASSHLLAPSSVARRLAPWVLAAAILPSGWSLSKLTAKVLARPEIQVARGTVRLGEGTDPRDLTRLLADISNVNPADSFFFYPYDPMLPYLTGRAHVTAQDLFTPGYTTPEQYRATCESVVGKAEWVVVDKRWSDPRVITSAFPNISDGNPPEKAAFEKAIDASFQTVASYPRYELRKRTTDATPEACSGITRQASL